MNKRAIFGVGAVSLAVGLLSASGAFASSLDYAMSVGQVDMGDTVNYVVEATSDGGYIAGGQTIQCFKIPNITYTATIDGGWISRTVEGELVPMSECEEHSAPIGGVESYKGGKQSKGITKAARQQSDIPTAKLAEQKSLEDSIFYDYCESPYGSERYNSMMGRAVSAISSTSPLVRLAEEEDDGDYYYRYYCVDYAAKFKQDGTKEWLTTIRNGDMPAAVGETNSDYRLLTKYGMLYTFAKTNGTEGISTSIGTSMVDDAIINQDGTMIIADDWYVEKAAANGSIVKYMDDTWTNEVHDEYYIAESPISKALVRVGDGIVAVHYHAEKTEDGSDWVETNEIVILSKDLEVISTVATFDDDDMEVIDEFRIASADQDGNILVMARIYDEDDDSYSTYFITIDKNGDAVAAKDVNELFGISNDSQISIDETPLILDNFTLVDTINNKLVRLSPQLTEIDNYPLVDGEMIYDATPLTDGSLAAVGRSSTSTDNYTVDGNMNGTYLRLTAKQTSGTTNPQTDDEDIKIYIAGGAAIILFGFGLVLRGSKRRAD